MEQDLLSIKEFNELLRSWVGKQIKITKYETNDHDEILLSLDAVSYKENKDLFDDYQSKYALQLNGIGKIHTKNNAFVTLPEPLYEIPLEDDSQYKFDGSRFSLKTDRGVYTIENIPPTE